MAAREAFAVHFSIKYEKKIVGKLCLLLSPLICDKRKALVGCGPSRIQNTAAPGTGSHTDTRTGTSLTTISGLEWKQPETTMASVGPPVMKPMSSWLCSLVSSGGGGGGRDCDGPAGHQHWGAGGGHHNTAVLFGGRHSLQWVGGRPTSRTATTTAEHS